MRLLLASASPARRIMLENAGLRFEALPAGLDERAAETPLLDAGMKLADVATALAMAKAAWVSERHPEAMVIGADQILDLDGERLTKPDDMEAARVQLLRLSGRAHRLHAAVACARGGTVVWNHLDSATLAMRALESGAIGKYLAAAGPGVLGSVGAYQLESLGVTLFDRIDGDFFTILGLPLLPLLAFLRRTGVAE